MDHAKRQGRVPNYDFMAVRHVAMAVSLFLVVGSLVSLAVKGLNLGIDFTGGTLVEVSYEQPVELGEVRRNLASGAFGGAQVQYLGGVNNVLVRLPPRDGDDLAQLSDQILAALRADGSDARLRRVEFVGPQVGDELTRDGSLALLWALGGILVYVAFRFHWQFALGAVVAVIHDAIITVGFFSVTGREFDLTVLAAVLAVIGYSLNDTIVIFDRVRELFRRTRKEGVIDILNKAVNLCLTRTITTNVTVVLVLLALLSVGGEIIRGFSIALLLGVVVGTYSTMYIASPLLLIFRLTRQDMSEPVRENAAP